MEIRDGGGKRNERTLDVRLLGRFGVWAAGEELTGARARSSLMWKLFRYFMLNREESVSTEKLIKALWPDDDCADPLRALYTLVYRLRGALNTGAGARRDFLIFNNDSYRWNGGDLCRVDLDEFNELCARAKTLPDGEAVECLERVCELYGGDLFADSQREPWMKSASDAARARFVEAASRLIGIRLAAGDFDAAMRLSERALAVDNYNESFHLGLLEALVGLGRHSLALAHYEYYAAMMHNEFGARPSARFDEIYERIRRAAPEVKDSIGEIMKRLDASDAEDSGPIYCDADTFTKIYHLERRIIERTGQSVFLACVRFEPEDGVNIESGELAEITSRLKRVTIFGLRRSDVITQISANQLLLLLMNVSYENCNEVVRRFAREFFDEHKGVRIRISHECRPLMAARDEIRFL